ncbi:MULTISPECIES: hypothetical protein [Deefgea]|uniref:Uncharacterized protein n=1 Tax=Deefgea chitinilytica TaxID=570276 RepID=A0ABS2CDQ3_9NEIS|nr:MULTISPECIES: hypothetical protein [Deefgea]MBM5571583.1 hypothetical protein [Deefgea chitinilytica]MBM9888818.1 hypothetical protein [Deefgea sp. CFH1-16]
MTPREEFEALLFDAGNHRLEAAEQARLANLLADHPEWQQELTQLQALQEGLREALPPLDLPADRWERFVAQLQPEPRRENPAPSRWKSRWKMWWAALNRPWAVMAALVIVVAQGILLHPMGMQPEAPQYRGGEQIPGKAAWLVSFSPDVTEAQLRDLLLRARMEIVSGPNAAGQYGLAALADADVDLLKSSALVQELIPAQ